MMDIIKNPVFIALVIGTMTYLYMWWDNKKKTKKNAIPEQINLYIPAAVTLITWFLAFGYFNNNNAEQAMAEPIVPIQERNLGSIGLDTSKFKLSGDVTRSPMEDSARSFQLISKGVSIPSSVKLPEVLLETQ